MAKLLWAVACQRVITDQQTNTVTHVDTIEQFGLPEIPHPCPPIWLATLWQREEQDDSLAVRVRVLSPKGKKLLVFEPELPGNLPKKRYRLNILIGGMPLPEVGEYQIILDQKRGNNWRRARILYVDIALSSDAVTDTPSP